MGMVGHLLYFIIPSTAQHQLLGLRATKTGTANYYSFLSFRASASLRANLCLSLGYDKLYPLRPHHLHYFFIRPHRNQHKRLGPSLVPFPWPLPPLPLLLTLLLTIHAPTPTLPSFCSQRCPGRLFIRSQALPVPLQFCPVTHLFLSLFFFFAPASYECSIVSPESAPERSDDDYDNNNTPDGFRSLVIPFATISSTTTNASN